MEASPYNISEDMLESYEKMTGEKYIYSYIRRNLLIATNKNPINTNKIFRLKFSP